MAKDKADRVKPKEFRYNKARSGHPAYIVKIKRNKEGVRADFIGITKDAVTHEQDNIPLDQNPNPKLKGTPAYIRPNVDEVKVTKKTFGKSLKDWQFAKSDQAKVRLVIKKSNKKR